MCEIFHMCEIFKWHVWTKANCMARYANEVVTAMEKPPHLWSRCEHLACSEGANSLPARGIPIIPVSRSGVKDEGGRPVLSTGHVRKEGGLLSSHGGCKLPSDADVDGDS